eukprot:TRINITY_DN7470_c0_g1_i1.p1 TRINITY_DN7470_c0_g1~~TRINITY_DN7470_c0_g1_i1.p1  ORF type:complete len:299 (+),score=63.59 TRINITY_DN7470_c0_g1_i1:76-897(+)
MSEASRRKERERSARGKRQTKEAEVLQQRRKEDDDEESSEDDESELSSEDSPWISWFCSLRGNEFFAEVDEDFIQDDFNLTGLSALVPNYDYALDMILDTETDEVLSEEQQEIVESAAEMLYGLIHARYILTNRGMTVMAHKYNNVHFGRCPRVYCQGQPALPVGQSDIPRMNTVKIFCPMCQDIYYPRLRRNANIDGAYFGTTFPHLLLQMYPDLQPVVNTVKYVPRIYGFKIHESARNNSNPNLNNNAPKNNTTSLINTSFSTKSSGTIFK